MRVCAADVGVALSDVEILLAWKSRSGLRGDLGRIGRDAGRSPAHAPSRRARDDRTQSCQHVASVEKHVPPRSERPMMPRSSEAFCLGPRAYGPWPDLLRCAFGELHTVAAGFLR